MPNSGFRPGFGPRLTLTATGLPLYEQIYQVLREAIVRGLLGPGARVASTRAIAADLSVSRFTVVSALERLVAEGYLVARQGSGTIVAESLPEQRMQAARQRVARAAPSPRTRAPRLSRRGTTLSEIVITGPRTEEGPRPFHPRRPALDVFPTRTWARLLAKQWKTARPADLDYGDPAGLPALREAIAAHVGVTRALRCEAHNVIVTSGAQQAFDMLFRLLLDPGDDVWMEDPGYLDVRAALVGAGASVIPVSLDSEGIFVADGIARAPHARMAVVSPSHQYPTGSTLSAPRRAALLAWARRSGAWIIEDDYDSFFRYRGRPVPALQRFDDESAHGAAPRVIYVGTFSKTMFPSLRLGFCIVPDALVDAAANARAVASRNAPLADQAALAAFMLDGHYDRHLRRARLVYEERYEAMRAAFTRELGGVVRLVPASAGTHVLGWFDAARARDRHGVSYAMRVAGAAAAEGLTLFPFSRYCIEPTSIDGLVLGYGAHSPKQIADGAARLARVIARV
jgi:GntR family transcriptional regulator/MocR family aminotransferase